MSALLEVKNLTTSFLVNGKIIPVVKGVSFTVEEGKTLALVGETGCGKSMTALSIMGIAPHPPTLPSQGEVLFKGTNLLTLPRDKMRALRGRHLAMIFQDPRSALNPVCSIGEQLIETYLAHLDGTYEEAKQRALEALEEVQLPYVDDLMGQYPHQLSGGMLQRVMIAMALICRPNILIADEPTTSLDVTIQKQILTLLKTLQQKYGMGILLITHDMSVVADSADEVIVLYAGTMIEQGPTRTLFSNPSHPYTEALFAARPTRPLREGRLPTLEGSVPSILEIPEGCLFHPRCSYCMQQCQKEPPPFFTLPKERHVAKCWLFDPTLAWRLDEDPDF